MKRPKENAGQSNQHNQKELFDSLFRDVVLVLGGVFADQQTSDDTICRISKGLCSLYRRYNKPKKLGLLGLMIESHPAINGILRYIERFDAS